MVLTLANGNFSLSLLLQHELRPQQLSALWDEGEQDGQAAEALAMFASNPLDDDLALLDGAGF